LRVASLVGAAELAAALALLLALLACYLWLARITQRGR